MKLGRASAYGLLALSAIATRNGKSGCATARDISDATGVPVEYLRKILQRLTHARLVVSERGRSGGFRLRRAIDQITLLQVVEAIEGPVDAVAIFDDLLLESTRRGASQRLRRWRHDAAMRLRGLLRETSLESICVGNGSR